MDERTPLDQDNQLLYAFLNRKKTRDNQAAMTAQRLVNLFRQLSSFSPEFVAQYNQMLLGANDEIQMMLQDIVGGPTVRQYLTYLKQAYGQAVNEQEGSEKTSVSSVNTGYLPSADDDTPFYKTALGFGEAAPKPSGESIVTIQDFTKWQKSQETLIRKAMMAQNKAISKLALALSEKKNTVDNQPTPPIQSAYPQSPFHMPQPSTPYVNQAVGTHLQSDLTQFEEPNPVMQNGFSSSDNGNQPVLSENTAASEVSETTEPLEEPTAFESFEEPPATTDNTFNLPEETGDAPVSFEEPATTDNTFALPEEAVEAPVSFEEPATTDNTFALPEESVEAPVSFEETATTDNTFNLPEEAVEAAESFEEIAETTDNTFALPEESVEPAESFEETAAAADNTFALPEESVEAPDSFEEIAETTDNTFALPEESVEPAESFEEIAETTDNTFALPEETVEPAELFEEIAETADNTFALPEEPVEAPDSFEPPEIIPELSFDAPDFSTTNTLNENQNEPTALPAEEIPVQPTPQAAMAAPNQPVQPENHLKPAAPPVSAFKNLSTKAPIPSALGNLFKFPKMPSFKPMSNLKPMGMPSQLSTQSPLSNKTEQSNEQSEITKQGGS